jgi:hypothetical protein
MGAQYRGRVDDHRLVDVANHVRHWLFRRESPKLWRAGKGKAV